MPFHEVRVETDSVSGMQAAYVLRDVVAEDATKLVGHLDTVFFAPDSTGAIVRGLLYGALRFAIDRGVPVPRLVSWVRAEADDLERVHAEEAAKAAAASAG